MLLKGLAVSAAEMASTHIVDRGATKAIQTLPRQKQSKIRGILMVVTALMLIRTGLKMLMNKKPNEQFSND